MTLMWTSEMTEHCGIGTWDRNSRIVRAVADDASFQFRREQVVWGVFAHEPMMARCAADRLGILSVG